MRRFITHPVVLLILVIVVATILFAGGKSVNGFSRFGLRTTQKHTVIEKNEYLQTHVDSSLVEDVISAHSTLGAGSIYGNLTPAGAISSIPQYIAAAQRLMMIDIVSYLENASDKEAGLDSLIGQMVYYQNQGSDIQTQLQEFIQIKTLDLNACATQKEDADREFYQGLREGDANTMMQGLEKSKKAGSCQAENKIDINAHTVMLRRVVDISNTSKNVSSLLTTNHGTIISNFSLFKDTYLEKLIVLRNDLRAKSPGTQ